MSKNKLITTGTTYLQILGPNLLLPEVADPTSLNLDREISLLRSVVAEGLSKKDDALVARTLSEIAAFLKRSERLTRQPTMSKVQLLELVELIVAVTVKETGIDCDSLQKGMVQIVEKAENQPDDFL